MWPFLGIQLNSVPARRRRLRFLRALGAVFRTTLSTISYADSVERAANYVIADAGKVLHTAAANQNNRVLLQVVANTRDVSRDFDPVGQTHTGDFPQRRVRLLGRLGVNASANATLLRTGLQRRTGRLIPGPLAAAAHQLIKSRHSLMLLRPRYSLRVEMKARKCTRHCSAFPY